MNCTKVGVTSGPSYLKVGVTSEFVFMHMRSSIELALQLLYFVDHSVEYSQWQEGKFLIKFNLLTEYIERHPLLIKDRNVKKLVGEIFKNWKHYSKHIHGESPKFFQCEKDARKTNNFSRGDYEVWKSNFTSNIYLVNKLFLLFFKADLNRFPQSNRNILVSLLKEEERNIINPS